MIDFVNERDLFVRPFKGIIKLFCKSSFIFSFFHTQNSKQPKTVPATYERVGSEYGSELVCVQKYNA